LFQPVYYLPSQPGWWPASISIIMSCDSHSVVKCENT